MKERKIYSVSSSDHWQSPWYINESDAIAYAKDNGYEIGQDSDGITVLITNILHFYYK